MQAGSSQIDDGLSRLDVFSIQGGCQLLFGFVMNTGAFNTLQPSHCHLTLVDPDDGLTLLL